MTTVRELHDRGLLSPLDLHLAQTLGRLGDEAREDVLLAVALLSRNVAHGHVCIDLTAPLLPLDDEAPDGLGELPRDWPAVVASSPLVGDADGPATPLILSGSRLYLQRQWQYECALTDDLRTRAATTAPIDPARFRRTLDALRPEVDDAQPDWQRVAAYVALRRRLGVVTGGPGTGKTTTVMTLVALALDQARARGERPPRVALCAPTGKAAARLTEALRAAAAQLPAELWTEMPDEARTIHRLLGASSSRPGRFRYDAHAQLPLDLVVVDEASMVDLALMARLVAAVPAAAGVVLLGDHHQLASVEAGAVLGDLCASADGTYDQHCAAEVHAATGVTIPTTNAPHPAVADCVVTLLRSHRFDTEGDVGRLAAAVRDGRADEVEALLASDAHPAVTRLEPPPADALHDVVARGYGPYVDAASADARLDALDRFRILCAHQHGPDGVHTMNHLAEEILAREWSLQVDAPFYEARPLLVTRNDYRIGLFNGDVGTIVRTAGDVAQGTPARVAVFRSPDGSERRLSPGRLPPCETAFAISIHKSQGSEFDRCLVMLPTRPSPVLSRELLYTAVSRARSSVVVCASTDAIRSALATPVRRASGLADRLRDSPPAAD